MASGDYSLGTQALKRHIQELCDEGVRKTTFYPLIARSLRRMAGEPRQLRRAKAFAYLLDHVELTVLPHEKLGGSILGMWPVVQEAPYDDQVAEAFLTIEREIKQTSGSRGLKKSGKNLSRALMARDHYDANISFASLQKIIKTVQKAYEGSDKISPQAIARTLDHHFVFSYGKKTMQTVQGLPWAVGNHLHLNYEMLLQTGYQALLRRIDESLATAVNAADAEKTEFYTAAKLSVEAAVRYILRYADAYTAAAAGESDAARAAELREIAATLRAVSAGKAMKFREALQLLWITHVIANTALGSALSFGRFDQYLLPFYQADKAAGTLTDDEAREWIAHMILKVNEPKMRTVQSLALGGTTPDGRDAANDLTRLTLEAAREVRMPYPNLSLRVSRELTPDWVYDEAIETIGRGFGMPMLLNDDVWVNNFTRLGYPVEYARDYYNMGCVEMMIQNRQAHWAYAQGSPVHFPAILDEVLMDHSESRLAVETFDDLMTVYVARITEKIAAMGTKSAREFVEQQRETSYDAFSSVLLFDCLGTGKDMYHGGSELPAQVAVGGLGLATATDSLCSIRELVFDRKEIGLRELTEAVHGNFRGREALRLRLSNVSSSFGNDDNAADGIAAMLFGTATAAVHALNVDPDQDRFVNSYFSYTTHVSAGELFGATPDGRRAGETFSDGLGPVQGRDTKGPTKLFNSLLKLDFRYLTGALATNLKINPSLFNSAAGSLSLKHLIKAYLKGGGPQLQVNFVRHEDLVKAQENPQAYRDIVVRIAGFCEYFVNLDYHQQNEIIMRTEHSTM